MKKLIVIIPAIIFVLIFLNSISIVALIPNDQNPVLSVSIENTSSSDIGRASSYLRTENSVDGFLVFNKQNNEFGEKQEIFSTQNITREVAVCLDQNLSLYSRNISNKFVSGGIETVKFIRNTNEGSYTKIRDIYSYHLESSIAYNSYADASLEVSRIKSKGVKAFVAYKNSRFYVRVGEFQSQEEAQNSVDSYLELLEYKSLSFYINNIPYTSGFSASILDNSQIISIVDFPLSVYLIDGTNQVTQIKKDIFSTLSVVGNEVDTLTVFDMKNDEIIFEFCSSTEKFTICSNDNALVYHRYVEIEALIPVTSDSAVLTNGSEFFGDFEFRIKDNKIFLRNLVKTQDYLKIVVPMEIGYKYKEALKAQAVVARNYALSKLSAPRHPNTDTILCDTTHCQAYKLYSNPYYFDSYGKLKDSVFTSVISAVDETIGVVETYNNSIVEIIYADSFGGKSLLDADMWYSSSFIRLTPKPYYISQNDPEDTTKNPFSYTFSKSDLYNIAYNNGKNNANIVQYPSEISAMKISTIEQIHVKRRSDSGIPIEIDLVNGDKRIQIKGANNILTFLRTKAGYTGIKCPNIFLNDITLPDENGNFVISGMGSGHNVGMSQTGAINRAIKGQTYTQILSFYYTDKLSLYTIK